MIQVVLDTNIIVSALLQLDAPANESGPIYGRYEKPRDRFAMLLSLVGPRRSRRAAGARTHE